MMGEAIELIRLLWTGDEVTFDGDYYTTARRGYTRPPEGSILSDIVAGPRERIFRRLLQRRLNLRGERAGGNAPDHRQLRAGAREEGKDPAECRKIECFVAYTDDEDAAIKASSGTGRAPWSSRCTWKTSTPRKCPPRTGLWRGTTRSKAGSVSPRTRRTMHSSRSTSSTRLQPAVRPLAGPDQYEFIDGYGNEVLPRIREGNRQVMTAGA